MQYLVVLVPSGSAGVAVRGERSRLPLSLRKSDNRLNEATVVGTAGADARVASLIVERARVELLVTTVDVLVNSSSASAKTVRRLSVPNSASVVLIYRVVLVLCPWIVPVRMGLLPTAEQGCLAS